MGRKKQGSGLHSVLIFGVLVQRRLRTECSSAFGAFELASDFSSCWLHQSGSSSNERAEYC